MQLKFRDWNRKLKCKTRDIFMAAYIKADERIISKVLKDERNAMRKYERQNFYF